MTTLLLRILRSPIVAINARSCFMTTKHFAVNHLNGCFLFPQTRVKRSWTCLFSATKRLYSSTLSPHEFSAACEETLDSLANYFEELVESIPALKNGDITYSDGVITANLGSNIGTYVINRQTPNQQIWLSSPTSGPKRYDFVDNIWVYKHDNTTLHSLLDAELLVALNCPVEFSEHCLFGRKSK